MAHGYHVHARLIDVAREQRALSGGQIEALHDCPLVRLQVDLAAQRVRHLQSGQVRAQADLNVSGASTCYCRATLPQV